MNKEDQIQRWLDDLAQNDAEAQLRVWELFADKISKQAKENLSGVKRRDSDEEDVTVRVLNSLFQRLADGRLEKPANATELWQLLLGMTRNKAAEVSRSKTAGKRGSGKVRGESAFGREREASRLAGIDEAAIDHRDPKVAFAEAEKLTEILDSLGDQQLRQIALLKMAGHSIEEISQQLDLGKRTVQRRLKEIRDRIG